jgi:hypothetical protein
MVLPVTPRTQGPTWVIALVVAVVLGQRGCAGEQHAPGNPAAHEKTSHRLPSSRSLRESHCPLIERLFVHDVSISRAE